MTALEWIVLAAAVVAALILVLAFARIRRRRAVLKEQFGREYGRAVADVGTGGAERRLSDVRAERQGLDIRPLPAAARERYLDEWRHAESRFVSDPQDSARAAESLVLRALEERGYPRQEDEERLVALVSVDHPDVAERYRHGHAMLETVGGREATENLRKAMLDFRAVLEDVVQGAPTAA